jgi:GNAT superfamily N-acetyltransferase
VLERRFSVRGEVAVAAACSWSVRHHACRQRARARNRMLAPGCAHAVGARRGSAYQCDRYTASPARSALRDQVQSDGLIRAHVSMLLIDPNWRGVGLGFRLLREALERAGGLQLDIRTRTDGYYERLGASRSLGFGLTRQDLGLDGTDAS